MKRLFAILLTLVLMLAGCGGSAPETTAPTEPPAPIAAPFTQAQLDAMPIANSNMTVDELRKICVDFMRIQVSIPWMPSKIFEYMNKGNSVIIRPDKVIGGMPYISLSQGSLYNFMHFYDEKTGTLDTDAIMALKQPYMKIVANQCSGSAFWAWARVSNTMRADYTRLMVASKGCIPIGPYYMDPAIQDFEAENKTTKSICQANGEQVMFESYALLLPADGVLRYTTSGGHVQMTSSKAVVVRNADGTIDGEKSYVTLLEQTSTWKNSTQSNGQPIRYQGGVDTKWTFDELYNTGYTPFTIKEFLGQDPVEKAEASSDKTAATVTVNDIKEMKVTSNYAISYTTITVKDTAGKVLYTKHSYTCTLNIYTASAISTDAVDEAKLQELANGSNTVEITARVGTGEILTAYTGVLAAS